MIGRSLVFIFILAVVLIWLYVQVSRQFYSYTNDAYVLTDFVVISPTVAGRLAEVYVDDNDYVEVGDPLFELDPEPFELDIDAAEAAVAVAEAAQQSAQDALEEATADVEASAAIVDDAKVTQERVQALVEDGFATQQRLDNLNRDLRTANADLAAAQAAVVVANDLVLERQAGFAAAQAALGLAQYNFMQSKVVSPYDGFVLPFTIRAGTYVGVGEQVMAIVDNSAWRIVANLPEQHLAHTSPAQSAWFMMASRPWVIYGGEVSSVSRGISRSENPIDPLPYVAPTTEWIRLSRRFPVEITIDDGAGIPLFLGSDARVFIWHGGERDE